MSTDKPQPALLSQIAGIAARGIGLISLTGLAAPLAWIAYSHWFIKHALPLPSAIDAKRQSFEHPLAGRLSYYADRSARGRPLVLIHSINAASSAYEMRPLFEAFRGSRPVYALDLPGFGFSARTDRAYTPELYQAAITGFIQQEVGISEGVDVIALSLGCEFTARAALEQPALFHSLTFIAPSGFSGADQQNRIQQLQVSGASAKTHQQLSNPFWSQPIYDLLATRTSIELFLKRVFVGPVDMGLVDYDYATTHQPGARFAPLYFVSGALFTANIREKVYVRLPMPVLVLYDEDVFVRSNELPSFCAKKANWQAVRIAPTRGLPQFERLDETVQAITTFWTTNATP